MRKIVYVLAGFILGIFTERYIALIDKILYTDK